MFKDSLFCIDCSGIDEDTIKKMSTLNLQSSSNVVNSFHEHQRFSLEEIEVFVYNISILFL